MDNLHIPITGDNTGFVRALNDAREKVRSTAREIEQSGMSIEDMFARIKQAAAISLAGFSAKEFIKKVVAVRGEFQQLEVAFKTMLGNAEKANELMQQLTRTAAATPFDLQGVTSGAKQLLAYGIAAEDVNSTLIHLGDIAAGLSLPLTDLVYLYGTTMVQGRMFTQDLRQFQNRGIPIAEELGKVLGVTKDKVGELITAGKVGAKEFNQAIMAMSSEGGKFGGLMEAQSKTITGQISNIEDAIDVMFNNIGKQSEGIINGTLSVVSSLVENYEKVGKIIASTIAVYGTYKAAVMAVCAVQSLQAAGIGALTTAEKVHYGWLVLCQKAQLLLNKTMLANPYVLVATAIVGLTTAVWALHDSTTAAEREAKRLQERQKQQREESENLKNSIEDLLSVVEDETKAEFDRQEAFENLKKLMPEVFSKYETEKQLLAELTEARKAENEEISRRNNLLGQKNYKDDKATLDKWKRYRELNKRVKGRTDPLRKQYGGLTEDEYLEMQRIWYSTILPEVQKSKGGFENTYDFIDRTISELEKTVSREGRAEADKQATQWNTKIKTMSVSDIEKDIELQKKRIKKLEDEGKDFILIDGIPISRSELERRIQEGESRKKTLQDNAKKNFRNEAKRLYTQERDALKALSALSDPTKRASSNLMIDGVSVASMGMDEFEAALKKQKEKVYEAEKKYKAFGGSVTDDKSAAQKAKETERANARLKELQDKQALEDARAAKDMEFFATQATIDAMEEGTEKTIAQMTLDFEKEKEEIRRDYEDLKQEKIDGARKLFEADPKNKDKVFDPSSVNIEYTDAEINNFREKNKAAIEEYARNIKNVTDSEMQAMYDYLKEYGSVQSQRLAIRKEYDKKIAEEDDYWRKQSLKKEKQAALDKITSDNLIANIDLRSVFSDYGKVLSAPLQNTIEQLEAYTKTESFSQRTITEQKEIFEAIQRARTQLGDLGGVSFDEIGRNLYDYNNAIIALNNASASLEATAEDVTSAMEEEEAAHEALARATTDEERAKRKQALDAASKKTSAARSRYASSEQDYNEAKTRLSETQAIASESLRKFQASIDNVGRIASAVASGSMKDLWNALGGKTQERIAEFVTGTHSYNKAIEEISATLSKKNLGLDYLVKRINGVAKSIYEASNEIDSAELGTKISDLFSELFGNKSKDIKKIGNDISNILNKVLSDAKESGEETGEAVKKASQEAIKAITKSSGSLWGLIIGLVFDLLDVLSEGIGSLVETILEKVGDAVGGILTEIGNGNFFKRIVYGVGDVIGGVAKGIGNLFTGGLLGRSNEDDMEEEIEKLSISNDALSKSIDALAEKISDSTSTNAESIDAYNQLIQAEKQWQENQRKAINDRASEWTNTGYGFLGLGGKKSFNHHAPDEDWSGWDVFNRVLREHGYSSTVSSGWNFWNLSPEEMQVLRDFANPQWAEFFQEGNEGHKDPSSLVDEYLSHVGKLTEYTDALNKKLTGYSFEGFLDSYKSILKDLTSETEDFGDKINEIISSALLESLVNDEFKTRIQNLYKYISEHAGNGLDSNEIAYIRQENESISNAMMSRRQNLIDSGLIQQSNDKYEQEASSKGFQTMSQDTADELNGRFTALQICGETISTNIIAMLETLNSMSDMSSERNEVLAEISSKMETANGYLKDVAKYNKKIYDDFGEKLDKIHSKI